MIYCKTNAWVPSPLTIFASSIIKTNRFHIVLALYSYKSQRTSKGAKNISDTLKYALLVFRLSVK